MNINRAVLQESKYPSPNVLFTIISNFYSDCYTHFSWVTQIYYVMPEYGKFCKYEYMYILT